jgi:hypothetical protein
MTYDGNMDEQCVPLCDAINAIPGLVTSESCCGHGRESFKIWFHLSDRKKIRFLTVIGRVFDSRYGGLEGWSCYLDNCDVPKSCPLFRIDSGDIKGAAAYRGAGKIAENIHGHLEHRAFSRAFLGKRPGPPSCAGPTCKW